MANKQTFAYLYPMALVATLGAAGVVATVAAGPVERTDKLIVIPGAHYAIPDHTPDPARVTLRVSLADQLLVVLEGGRPIAWSAATTGASYAPTPTGRFTVLDRARDHRSRDFGGAAMPHMLRLTEGGVAIHGGPLMTGPASGGCVRLPEDFAAWLFAVTRLGTVVEIET